MTKDTAEVMEPKVYTYRGQVISEMSREELVDALTVMAKAEIDRQLKESEKWLRLWSLV
jgi:hypothetical protein